VSRLAVRLGAVVAVTGAVVLGLPGTASAHPLGNFTVNRYSGVVVSSDAVGVDHVVDLAEVPTAQRTPAIDTDGDGSLSRPELGAWAVGQCRAAARSLRLTVDGRRADLTVRASSARTAPGQAGLPTLRLECDLRAPATIAATTAVRLADGAVGGEVGWREMTARGDGTTLSRSDAPQRSRSARLTAYPEDLLSDPLDVRSVRPAVRPGGPLLGTDVQSDVPAQAFTRGADRLTLAFEGLLTRTEGHPLLGLVAVLAALALGAAHAVAPGHGKTVMAFYLSGRREGALRAAATVGATVTATHTAGVLALGLLVSAGTAFVPARVYPWLSLVSGLLVVLVGLALLRDAAARRTRVHDDGTHSHGLLGTPHSHDRSPTPTPAAHAHQAMAEHAPGATATLVRVAEHDHDHEHEHDHPHHHDEQPAPLDPPSRRGLIAMGLAGGLLPSPSALLVLLGAVALGHAWFGVVLVVAFGLGMAGTLAVVGLLVMRLRERAELRLRDHPASRLAPLLRIAPVATAAVVVVLGAVLAWRGLGTTGLL
jgi:ABC-type nickel/cobalt efflux system permease component RcnA